MLGRFFAVLAVFMQLELLRCIELVSNGNVVKVPTNSTF